MNLYAGDESRFGMHTKSGRMLTVKGVKPICNYQQTFENTYLFGAFSPITGDKFLLELPECNAEMFQLFLDNMSLQNPDEFKILLLDNGAFHKAKKLKIPENIELLFLPPYSPELNPAEKIWALFKRAFTNKSFNSLSQITEFFIETTKTLSKSTVKSICAFSYFFSSIDWTM